MRFEYVEDKPGASIKEFGKPFKKISLTQSLFQAPTVSLFQVLLSELWRSFANDNNTNNGDDIEVSHIFWRNLKLLARVVLQDKMFEVTS